MASSMGGYPTAKPESVCQELRGYLRDGVSLMAVEEETGDVVGIRTARVLDR